MADFDEDFSMELVIRGNPEQMHMVTGAIRDLIDGGGPEEAETPAPSSEAPKGRRGRKPKSDSPPPAAPTAEEAAAAALAQLMSGEPAAPVVDRKAVGELIAKALQPGGVPPADVLAMATKHGAQGSFATLPDANLGAFHAELSEAMAKAGMAV